MLVDMYKKFLNCQSRRNSTCIEPEGMNYLWTLCEKVKPDFILDLGSGLSSWLFRAYARHRSCSVVTVDHSKYWLNVCRRELRLQELSFDRTFVFSDWVKHETRLWKYDLIFFDMDECRKRYMYMPVVLECLKIPQGLLVIDDWHFDHMKRTIRHLLDHHGLIVNHVPETLDQFGRYMALCTCSKEI